MYDHSGSRDPSGALLIVASSLVVTELEVGFDQFGIAHGTFRPSWWCRTHAVDQN
jgi:hypothetical protein